MKNQERRVGVYQAEKWGKAGQMRNHTREGTTGETLEVLPNNSDSQEVLQTAGPLSLESNPQN